MPRFTKKPITIEAVQFTGHNAVEVLVWCPSAVIDLDGLAINTLEGVMRASVGDWIIRGVKGEYYPCKPDIFAATYDPAEDQTDGLFPPARACDWTEDAAHENGRYWCTCSTCGQRFVGHKRRVVCRTCSMPDKTQEREASRDAVVVPRRIDRLRHTPAERAITDAMQVVEEMAADVRLTQAVILLGRARDLVADYVDGMPYRPASEHATS